jgi:short-subunit dehydrogenase involved in D-alanine esterification of teichoic acids
LNVLVNNAGIMRKIDLRDTANRLEDINGEIETDLTGPVRSKPAGPLHVADNLTPAQGWTISGRLSVQGAP